MELPLEELLCGDARLGRGRGQSRGEPLTVLWSRSIFGPAQAPAPALAL